MELTATVSTTSKRMGRIVSACVQAFAIVACLLCACASGFGQSMQTFTGLNTVQDKLNASATPDPTIAVGTLEYCEHVNSAYQCWYKSGVNANDPVFLPISDSTPWSQNNNNSGNTPNCPTAFSPNSQLLHDNVYDVWILEKRITSKVQGDNFLCVAISNMEDVSSSNFSWFAFEYNLDNVIPQNSHGNYYYPDYPQSGLWQSSTSSTPPYTPATDQALWITYDLMDPNNADNINGVLICAVDIAGLRNSTSNPWQNNSHTPACVVAETLQAYNQRRSWIPANNSDTTPPIDADGEMVTYLVEPAENKTTLPYLTAPTDTQEVQQWTINWTATPPTPTLLNTWELPSTNEFHGGTTGDQVGCFLPTNYYNTVCVPQPSTATTGIYIDSVGDRMMQFFHYTSNNGTGSIWTSSHIIQITPSQTVNSQTEADIRILQRNSVSPNAVYVADDYPLLDPVDPNAYVFMPSAVRDKAGNLQGIIGISGPGTDEHPGLDSFTLNVSNLQVTTYGYIASPVTDGDAEDTDSLNYRWGDWFSGVLDPSDSCTVWVAGEYLPENRTTEPYWYTEIAKLPPTSACSGNVTLSSVNLNFGNQQLNVQSSPIVETVTNNQTTTLNITGISTNSSEFTQTNTCQQPLAAGGSCTIDVYFTPTSTGTQTGTLTITDNAASSPQTAALTGTGVSTSLSATPAAIAYGNQVVGTTSSGTKVTVTNNGFGNVTINSVAASGGFGETDNCSGATLTQGQTCTVTVTFSPGATGSYTGVVSINSTAANAPQIVTMTGSGIAPASLSANLTFGVTDVGVTDSSTMTLTNNENTSLTYTYTTSGDYSAVGNGTTPCNGTVAAKSKCTFNITFAPTTNGVIKGAITITFSGTGAPNPISGGFSGTGQDGPASPFSLTPASLTYGNVALGSSSSSTVTIKNNSGAAVSISSVTGSGPYTVAPSGTTPCGGNLNAAAKCTVTVTFTPTVAGTLIGGVTISSTAAVSTQVQNATGTGVQPITLSPTSISFGTDTVGTTSGVQVVTVTNYVLSAVPINSIVASGDFIYTSGGGIPCGASVAANSTCTIGVEFSPTVAGAISGELTVSFGAENSPQEVSLTGTGEAPEKNVKSNDSRRQLK
jgi:hypothetical protein